MIWIVNLIKKQYHEKKIDSIQLELLLKQVSRVKMITVKSKMEGHPSNCHIKTLLN